MKPFLPQPAVWVLSLWMGTACSPGALPNPVIEGLTPSELPATSGADLSVQLSAVLPYQMDYGDDSVELQSQVEVYLGDQLLGVGQPNGAQEVIVPYLTRFRPGAYDVRVRLADGREATREAGFTVLPAAFPTSYTVDFIPEQREGDNFEITIRAQGENAETFAGTVDLSVSQGRVNPGSTGNFEAGVRTQRVRIRNVADETVTLTVTDAEGHSGTSNPFFVRD